jgi:hypothetical protein
MPDKPYVVKIKQNGILSKLQPIELKHPVVSVHIMLLIHEDEQWKKKKK